MTRRRRDALRVQFMQLTRSFTWALIAVSACGATWGTDARASDIRRDEEVIFFPTAAHLDAAAGEWIIPVHGWIFEPERNSLRRRVGIEALKRRLELDPDEPSTQILDDRLSAFLVDNERSKLIEITLGDESYRLAASDESGHFHDQIRVNQSTAEGLAEEGWLTFAAVTPARDDRSFRGRARLVPPQGLSVISDIDDTLKLTGVTDKRELIRRTFFTEFEAAPGMASLCGSWKTDDVTFHYVSSSPWQLYPSLAAFFDEAGFPAGSWHLKDVRLRDSSILNLLSDPFDDKIQKIEEILTRYPEREFLFVGDSGEQDPEVYGELARRHPTQVSQIFIRLSAEDQAEPKRFAEAFRDVPRDRWTVFSNPDELHPDGDN